MRTEEWLSQGNLEEAIAQARQDVSRTPENAGFRFLLFELLVLAEDFDGAENELRHCAIADPNLAESVEFYQGLLNAERLRYNCLNKAIGAPQALLEPPSYGTTFIQALWLLCQSRVEEAEALLARGWQEVPKISGSLDGERFTEIRDADDVLGPFLEALVPGSYFWIPFEQIERINFKHRRGYQETIWMPAYLEMKGGIQGDLWIPSLYSGTGAKDDFLRLGQMTTWDYPSKSIGRVYGQRDLKTDKILKGIRKVSTILIDRPSSN